LKVVIEHFTEVFPEEIINSFEENVFLTCSIVREGEIDSEFLPRLSIPTSIEKEKSGNSYVLINMMVSRY